MTSSHVPPDFAGTARLFPLPNLVLFPHVIQGLHVFEPRYRQLMADAIDSDQFVTPALLKPGWDQTADDRPPIEPVACLGQVTWHEKLPDGRFNLRLQGLVRLRIMEEVPSDRLYRIARAEVISEFVPGDMAMVKKLRHTLADLVLGRFEDDGPARRQLQELFDGEMPLGQVCDVLGYALPLSTEMKQGLLAEAHVDRRAVALIDVLRASSARVERPFPPGFSPN